MFKKVKGDLGDSKQSQSNLDLLNWMKKLGLACGIEADGATFYLLEMGASPKSEIDPLELMMAYEPAGVACYFSAIAYHSLTTQMPSHHHVAVLTSSSEVRGTNEDRQSNNENEEHRETIAKTAVSDNRTRKKCDPLGKVVFSYLDIPYHVTRRKKTLMPGVQNRSNGPRGQLRITTYEQTLLDTLHRPQNCGGPAVVLEAWQEAIASRRLDEKRMVEYLTRMEYPSTTRRLGAMFHLMDYKPGSGLAAYLDQVKKSFDRESPYSRISLLPGFEYTNLDNEWLVKSP